MKKLYFHKYLKFSLSTETSYPKFVFKRYINFTCAKWDLYLPIYHLNPCKTCKAVFLKIKFKKSSIYDMFSKVMLSSPCKSHLELYLASIYMLMTLMSYHILFQTYFSTSMYLDYSLNSHTNNSMRNCRSIMNICLLDFEGNHHFTIWIIAHSSTWTLIDFYVLWMITQILCTIITVRV